MQRQPQYTDSPDSTCSDVAPLPSSPPEPLADARTALPRLLGDAGNKSQWQPVRAGCSQQREQPTERIGARAQSLKSQMCQYFKTEMGCRFGDRCAFAHSTEEWQRAPDPAKKWVPKIIAKEESQEAPDLGKASLCKTIAKASLAKKWVLCKTIAKEESQRALDLAKKWVPKTIAKEDVSWSVASSARRPSHQSAPDEDDWEWEDDWDISLYVNTKDGVDGNTVRAEFTGSELRDRDLPDVFEHLGKELWKVYERRGDDYKLDVDFSVNKGITDKGVADHLVPFLDRWPNCHRLKLYKTSCSEEAIRALIPWVSLGYARELHLSDMGGQVSGEAILELLRQVHRGGNFPYLNSDQAQCALWLRLEHNGVPSEEVVKKAKAEGLSFRVLDKNDLFYVRPGVPTWGRKCKAEAVHLVLFHVQDVRVKRTSLAAVAKAEAHDRPKSSEQGNASDAVVAEVEAHDRPKSSEEGSAGDAVVGEAEAPLCETIAKVESQRAPDLAKSSLCKAIAEKLQAASCLPEPKPFLRENVAQESQDAPDLTKTSLCEAFAKEIRRRALEQARRVGDSAQQHLEKATAPARVPGHKGQSKGVGTLAAVLRNIPLPNRDVSAEPSSVQKMSSLSVASNTGSFERFSHCTRGPGSCLGVPDFGLVPVQASTLSV